jgi:hypothetical protein
MPSTLKTARWMNHEAGARKPIACRCKGMSSGDGLTTGEESAAAYAVHRRDAEFNAGQIS